jgi:hypothetical protein
MDHQEVQVKVQMDHGSVQVVEMDHQEVQDLAELMDHQEVQVQVEHLVQMDHQEAGSSGTSGAKWIIRKCRFKGTSANGSIRKRRFKWNIWQWIIRSAG